MNFKLSQYLGVISLLLASINLSAQADTTIYIQDMQVEPAQIIDVDVQVTGYQDIVSTSFSVIWDSMNLRYVGVDNIPFDLSEDDAFNISTGALSFLYFDMSLGGNSIDDEGILFTVQLEVIGTDGTQTEIEFGGNIEVVDVDGANNNMPLDVDFVGGLITIGEPNSVTELSPSSVTVDISPNPFAVDANVVVHAENGGEMNWTLSEVNGQQITAGVTNLTPGRNTFKLENTLFKHTGTYILKMQLGDKIITKQLLRVAP